MNLEAAGQDGSGPHLRAGKHSVRDSAGTDYIPCEVFEFAMVARENACRCVIPPDHSTRISDRLTGCPGAAARLHWMDQ